MFYEINNINFKSTIQGEFLLVPEVNRELGIHTYENKFIITDIKTGARVSEGNTKDKSIKELLKFKNDINNITVEREEQLTKQLNKLVDYQTYEKYKQLFSDTFGHDIVTFCNVWVLNISRQIKLDVQRFDDFFKMENDYHNMSLKEWINARYGDKGLEVIEYFI